MIYEQKDGSCVISANRTWLAGSYEDRRAATFAFRLDDEARSELRDNANIEGRNITWQDIRDYRNKK